MWQKLSQNADYLSLRTNQNSFSLKASIVKVSCKSNTPMCTRVPDKCRLGIPTAQFSLLPQSHYKFCTNLSGHVAVSCV